MFQNYLSKLLTIAAFTVLANSAFAQLSTVTVNAPASIAGGYYGKIAAWSPVTFSVTGDLAYAEFTDTLGNVFHDGCAAIPNVSGKVALIDRGTCGFAIKAVNAQQAGAIAIIICNNQVANPSQAIAMGGVPTETITIPGVMLSYGNCQTIKAELAAGINVTLGDGGAPAPGPGEGCATADVVGPGTHITPDMTTGLGGFAGNGHWYSYTPAATTLASVSSCLGGVNTRLWIVTDGCAVQNSLSGNRDDNCDDGIGGGTASEYTWIANEGVEYLIMWDDLKSFLGFTWTLTESALPAVDVTFTVDLFYEDIDPAGAHIAGSFNGWTPTQMTDIGDGKYSYTAAIQTGQTVEYKFLNGPGGWEDNFTDCGMNNNRFAVLNSLAASILPAVCFNSCEACPIPPCTDPNALICDNFDAYLAGTTTGGQAIWWSTWSGTLGAAEDGIVSAEQAFSAPNSMLIQEGQLQDVLLKLDNVAPWENGGFRLGWQMFVPTGKNGYYNIQDDLAPGVQWNLDVFFNREAATAGTPTPGMGQIAQSTTTFAFPQDAWFEVSMAFDLDKDEMALFINGTLVETTAFTGRLATIDFFSIDANNRYWVDDIKFVVLPACDNPDAIICDNLEFYQGGTSTGPYQEYWSTWSGTEGAAEDGIVSTEYAASGVNSMLIQEGQMQDVLLKLGNKTEGTYFLDWDMYIPAGRVGYYNMQNTEVPGVQWNLNVHFGNDAAGATAVFGTGIVAEGALAFTYPEDTWFNVAHVFDLDNDTYDLWIDGVPVAEGLAYAGGVGAIDFFSINADNRYYIDNVNYSALPVIPTVAVTFQVDMTWEIDKGVPIEDIKIAGNFTTSGASVPDWTPPSSPVFTAIGGDVYEVTIEFPETAIGGTLLYKFLNTADTWGACGLEQECLAADATCTTAPDNRTLVIPATDQTYCFTYNTCEACNLPNSTNERLDIPMTIAPNPFNSQTLVTFHTPIVDAEARLTTLTGQLVYTYQVSGQQLTIERGTLAPGVYFLNVVTENGVSAAQKLVVQ